MTSRHSLVVVALLLQPGCVGRKRTRHEDKPPGWRPDLPKETASQIVERMLRRLRQAGEEPGRFFGAYDQSWRAMSEAQEAMRPATLKSPNEHVEVDDELQQKLAAAESAFAWQHAQVAHLQGVSKDDDVANWPESELDRLLMATGVVKDEGSLARLAARVQRTALAADIASVLRIFEYTFASMPDDEEAAQITLRDNAKSGYPPPSPPPPPPPSPPPPSTHASAHASTAEASKPKPKKRRRRTHDEL
jgi:hypothetical protein